MQTIYYETSSFIRHEGNVVDLSAYRHKLAAVSGDDWGGEPQVPEAVDAEPGPLLTLVPPEAPALRRDRRRRKNVRRAGVLLDLAASAAILAMTLTAVVQFVRF